MYDMVPDIGRIVLGEEAEIGGVRVPAGAELRVANGGLYANGQRLDLALTTADVHDPTELPTYLAGYSNEEFRAEEIAPPVLVDKDEDKYRTFNTAAAFKPVRVKTDDESDIPQLKVESSLTNYKVQPRRIGAFIPDHVQAQAGPNYDVKFVHMQRCKRVINMDLEIDILGDAGLLCTLSNWDANQQRTLNAATKWGGTGGAGVDSNPIRDIREMNSKSAQRITGWWFNPDVAGDFLDHPAVRDYLRLMKGDTPMDATLKAIKEGDETIDFSIIGLGKFHVMPAKFQDPADDALKYIMRGHVVATHAIPGVPVNGESIATVKNFRRRGMAGNGFGTREVRIEWRGAGGTLVIAEEASIPTMTSKISGAIIRDARI